MKKLLLIYNPRSGKGKIAGKIIEIRDILEKGGYDVILHPTTAALDAKETVAARANEMDMIVCCGGDGTLDETVSGLLESGADIPIGYIPAGSTNDFAGSLGIPKNPIKAAERIVEGEVYQCDIGSFNGHTFVYIAAFGMFTEVSYETDQHLKNVLGHAAYVLEAGKKLFDVPSHHVKIDAGETQIEGDFAYGMVTNSKSVGGMKNITGQEVEMNDGLFEVTLVKAPNNPIEFSEAITSALLGKTESEMLVNFKTDFLVAEFDEEVRWTFDGEMGEAAKTVEIKNMKQILKIMR